MKRRRFITSTSTTVLMFGVGLGTKTAKANSGGGGAGGEMLESVVITMTKGFQFAPGQAPKTLATWETLGTVTASPTCDANSTQHKNPETVISLPLELPVTPLNGKFKLLNGFKYSIQLREPKEP